MTTRTGVTTVLCLCALASTPRAEQAGLSTDGLTTPIVPGTRLAPTDHPRLSPALGHLWLAPDLTRPSGPAAALAAGLKRLDADEPENAIAPLTQAAAEPGLLAHHALVALARAYLALGKPADALRAMRLVWQREPVGFVREVAALVEGEALEAAGDDRAALAVYERLLQERPAAPDQLLLRAGRVAERTGDTARAVEHYARVYYEWPLGEQAAQAKSKLDQLTANASPADRTKQEIARAQRLFEAKQYGLARIAFAAALTRQTPAPSPGAVDNRLIQLRLAECDYHLKRYSAARDGLAGLIDRGPRHAEALFYFALASRATGQQAIYVKTLRRVIDEFPGEPWGEDALNDLATRYIRADADEEAEAVMRELIARYPRGRFTERAVWKVGWRALGLERYDEVTELFDRAAAEFPRSDFRPAWLFWSARAHGLAGRREAAEARYTLTAIDYLNSYYGRLATARLNGRLPSPRVIATAAESFVTPPPNDQIVRALLEIERFDLALGEVRYAQRHWGDSPTLQATTAWIYRHQGLTATGREQFNLLRGSITLMRRAYPQFMAAGGEQLPREVLSLIFPMSFWDLIQKHAAARGLDPYLVAALVAQESTFTPDVRSSANAVGLMQLIPSTARVYAKKLGLKYSPQLMVDPESNIRMGTAYLADKLQEFGDLHLALASYNAGEGAVRRWLAERARHPADQFIDDIPYPETQNYVKRILGTQEDYRRLYGSGQVMATAAGPAAESGGGGSAVAVADALGGPSASDSAVSTPSPRPRTNVAPPTRRAPTGEVKRSRAPVTKKTRRAKR